jgi:phosphatidylglycerol---prolipoprotein diacylglyceryl transferase
MGIYDIWPMQALQLYIQWNPGADAFHIGANFAIKWYGIFWGLSLFACFFLARYVFEKVGKSEEKITLCIQYIFIGGLIGARLAHVLFYNLDYYLANPWTEMDIFSLHIPIPTVIAVREGGLASHGGVVGGLIGLWLFCRRNKEFSFFWTLDHGIICIAILASLIRFGNLMNSELYGKPSNLPWAFVFTQVDNVPRHPVVLYESICYLLIQGYMLLLFNKYCELKPGIYTGTFLALVFGVRFVLEFAKVPDGEMIGFISKTQLLDLPFMIAGLAMLIPAVQNKLHYSNNPVATHGKV